MAHTEVGDQGTGIPGFVFCLFVLLRRIATTGGTFVCVKSSHRTHQLTGPSERIL